MNTKQIIDEMEKELMAQIVEGDMDYKDANILIHSYTRKLIESVAEELIGRDQTSIHRGHEIDGAYCIQCDTFIKVHPMRIYGRNQLRAKQRLKVKEIITNLK